MLQNKKLSKYNIARYPQRSYQKESENVSAVLGKKFIIPVTILTLIEICSPVGAAGPPPVRVNFLTENEAASAIEEVFLKHGITLQKNVEYTLPNKDVINIDGFNSKLKIGYEYISRSDWRSPIYKNRHLIQQSKIIKIKFIYNLEHDFEYKETIEKEVRSFIQMLKSSGSI